MGFPCCVRFPLYVLPPLPRCSDWASSSLISPSRISLPRKRCRVGLRIVLFEACSAFTRVAARTLAPSPIVTSYTEGFSHFVTSMTAPVASGWSVRRVGLARTTQAANSLSEARAPTSLPPHWKAPPCHSAHVLRLLQIATANGASGQVSRPCLATPIGAVVDQHHVDRQFADFEHAPQRRRRPERSISFRPFPNWR